MTASLLLLSALSLAFYTGLYRGREKERIRISRGQMAKWEMDLLRARGNRVHPDPSTATRISRIHIRR